MPSPDAGTSRSRSPSSRKRRRSSRSERGDRSRSRSRRDRSRSGRSRSRLRSGSDRSQSGSSSRDRSKRASGSREKGGRRNLSRIFAENTSKEISSRVENSEVSSDSSEEEERMADDDVGLSRRKKIRKVDISNPFSTFEKQTRNKKHHYVPSQFMKEKWLQMRGMDESGQFIYEDESKTDAWKFVAKSDRLVKKYAGEIFGDTKLDDGLHSIVDRSESQEEKDLVKLQRAFGSIGHLALKAMEGYATLYKKLEDFVNAGIGEPRGENPEYTGPSDTVNPRYVWSETQLRTWNDFQGIQRELQVDVAEPIANASRIAAASYTNMLDRRREKVLSRIRKKNSTAATAINRIPPSSSHMFGGDHAKLERVVKLDRDLANNQTKANLSGSSFKPKPKYKGSGGQGHGSGRGGYGGGKKFQEKPRDPGTPRKPFRGGNSFRGGKN